MMEEEEVLLASHWHFRGEGAANIVLGYGGSSPAFTGKVLRLQKVSGERSGESSATREVILPVLTLEEQILWGCWPCVAAATSVSALNQAFARDVVIPFLGHRHVDPGELVPVSPEFSDAMNTAIHEERPEWRAKYSKIDVMNGDALLILDHSMIPSIAGVKWNATPTVSVEIKPKCGFLPISVFIAKENAIKKRVPRFSMHQHLKLARGMIKTVSRYSPLDLFSGSYEKIREAIQALFETPQNNLRVFVDGVLVFGTSAGCPDSQSSEKGGTDYPFESVDRTLKRIISCRDGKRVSLLQRLVLEFLYSSESLSLLLEMQKLDLYDIEGAIHAYYKLLQKRNKTCLGSENRKVDHGIADQTKENDLEGNALFDWLSSLTLEDCRRVVRDYLIAATAKDCSIMITFKQLPIGTTVDDDFTQTYCLENGQNFCSKVHVDFEFYGGVVGLITICVYGGAPNGPQ